MAGRADAASSASHPGGSPAGTTARGALQRADYHQLLSGRPAADSGTSSEHYGGSRAAVHCCGGSGWVVEIRGPQCIWGRAGRPSVQAPARKPWLAPAPGAPAASIAPLPAPPASLQVSGCSCSPRSAAPSGRRHSAPWQRRRGGGQVRGWLMGWRPGLAGACDCQKGAAGSVLFSECSAAALYTPPVPQLAPRPGAPPAHPCALLPLHFPCPAAALAAQAYVREWTDPEFAAETMAAFPDKAIATVEEARVSSPLLLGLLQLVTPDCCV